MNIFAYIAGYFDGDGCFYIGKVFHKDVKRFKYRKQIIISTTNISIIDILKKHFNCYVSKHSKRPGDEKWKTQYNVCIKSDSMLYFIGCIYEFLIEKRTEADIFIKFMNTKDKETRDSLIKEMKIQKHETNLVIKAEKQLLNDIIPSKKISLYELNYLAGFIDAECCLSIQRYYSKNSINYTYKAVLRLNNTKAPIFKWLVSRIGGSVIFIDRKTKNIKHRNQFVWRLISNPLKEILIKIYPFIKQKKKICKCLISFNETIIRNGGDRHTIEFKESFSRILKKREIIFNKVHKLNLKGI